MRVDLLSLFPEFFSTPLATSILKRAIKRELLNVGLINIRDFSDPPHYRTDERPYGGGPGMVMMAPPVVRALRSVRRESSHTIYLSPSGAPLTAARCRELADHRHLIVLCGHYEGIDERCLKDVDEQISIGDYVLTSGCAAALVLLDAVVRLIPGVLGHDEANREESFETPSLDWPHYTRPEAFEGEGVPEVLLSGNHSHIAAWRKEAALKKTATHRPDLLKERAVIL